MSVETKESGLKEKGLSAILMFVIGFTGFSLVGTIILIALLSLGIIPAI